MTEDVKTEAPILASYLIRVTVRANEGLGVVALTNDEIETLVEGRVTDAYQDGGVIVRASSARTDR